MRRSGTRIGQRRLPLREGVDLNASTEHGYLYGKGLPLREGVDLNLDGMLSSSINFVSLCVREWI